MAEELSRRQQQEIRALQTRHGRKKADLCLCEGLRCCSELFAARPDLVRYTVLTAEADAEMTFVSGPKYVVGASLLAELSATVNSQGILCVAGIPGEPSGEVAPTDEYLLALDRVGDPGNFGTICRTARASGLTELWYTRGSVDPWSDKVIRSALGAQFGMRLRSFDDLTSLAAAARAFGYGDFCISTPHGGENCFTAEGIFSHSVMVIGSESAGAEMLDGCRKICIPMPGGFESLNAAQAATILLFEAVRRKESR